MNLITLKCKVLFVIFAYTILITYAYENFKEEIYFSIPYFGICFSFYFQHGFPVYRSSYP